MPIFTHRERSLLFIHVPKTGGTSVEEALAGVATRQLYCDGIPAGLACPPQHLHHAALAAMLDLAAFDARLAVVRHPVDRLVSEFKMRTARRNRTLPFEVWAGRALDRAARDPWYMQNHLRPQSAFVGDGVEVFRFEDGLAAPLARAAAALGLDEVPVAGHSRPGREAETRASAPLMARIAAVYAEDFARFGYRPEDAAIVVEPAPGALRRLGHAARRLMARPDKQKRRPS